MRIAAPLDDTFASRGHVRVLRALAGLPEGCSASAREIARRANVAHNRTSRILANLAEQGVADVERVARSDLYRLNRAHALFPLLERLFADERTIRADLERFLRRRLRALVPGIDEAYLFGSVARGESRLGSDIDLAVVVRRGKTDAAAEALAVLGREVRRGFGSELSVHFSSEPLARRAARSADGALWRRIQAEGVQIIPAQRGAHA